ncbi:hypothetical protein ACFSQD_01140 [Flavihumibacter stibioxidans]|uniref:DNA mismatch repair proteins mutS family domain-containing protein n=2 Tax=Flavihumibacter stibioxidans TaxID=1834163 RepID=A0ABR7MAK9_9BACT|nr:hypothetical protein [Flavihumibacter stibioxidans]MBC6492087.1 hypothetical protein [Flavihumibacter stibioxidans]
MVYMDPLTYHKEKETAFRKEKEKLAKQKNTIAWARVGTLLAGAWLVYQAWQMGPGAAFLVFAVALGIFLWLLRKSLGLADDIRLLEHLISIHQEEEQIAGHQFNQRFNGLPLAPKNHAYSGDLDLFGQASLFQYIHRSTSEQGHQLLANWLLEPASNDTIRARQDAARELSGQPDWSARFQAIGLLTPVGLKTETSLQNWLVQPAGFFPKKGWRWLAILFPVGSLSVLALHILGIVESPVFYSLVILFMIIAFSISRKVLPQYRALDSIVPQLNTLSDALQTIEKASFTSQKLKDIQALLHPANLPQASLATLQLRKILDRFDYRLNPLVFVPLNTFTLWDLQQVWSLEKWKHRNSRFIGRWFEALAEMEALNSLGRLAFNHPAWVFPQLTETPGHFSGKGIGHPLIPAGKRINNDFSTDHLPAIALITGSNMAGKSTFLRSIGINQVLAMSGAPSCSVQLTVSNMRIMSSMRIADNLEENTSTFYAELSKLKSIIEAVNRKEPVFLLLDEILRGTNSQDRQTGSRALIIQLIKQSACGLLATHDLALTELAQQYPDAITNYHFDVSVEGEELYFDYKLKTGICQSMNASILMKKIGIDL